MQRRGLIRLLGMLGVSQVARAAEVPSAAPCQPFDAVADAALLAMKAKAEELKVGGCAVVCYCAGDTLAGWSSKMLVVGRYRDEPSANDKGSNLLGIVYAKAAEMADTHRDSGSHQREPMTGELGWQGGVTARGKSGFLIAAFSGGKSEDDVQISRDGLQRLQAVL